jgi:hypothetical protein
MVEGMFHRQYVERRQSYGVEGFRVLGTCILKNGRRSQPFLAGRCDVGVLLSLPWCLEVAKGNKKKQTDSDTAHAWRKIIRVRRTMLGRPP